jgi:hypothetical protein
MDYSTVLVGSLLAALLFYDIRQPWLTARYMWQVPSFYLSSRLPSFRRQAGSQTGRQAGRKAGRKVGSKAGKKERRISERKEKKGQRDKWKKGKREKAKKQNFFHSI